MRPTSSILAVILMTIPSIIHAEPIADDQPWSASVTAGFSDYAGDKARPFGSASLSRELGNWSLGLAASIADSGEPRQSVGVVHSTTEQLILSIGYSAGSIGIDAHGAIGRRQFEDNAFTRASGAGGTLTSDGSSASAGISVSDDIAIGSTTFLSPFISLDYDQVDVARLITLPNRSFVIKENQRGVTGALGATLITAYGPDHRHNVGVYGAVFTTSNDAASSIGLRNSGGAPRSTEGAGGKDSWFEVGPTASFGLTSALHIDLAATRSFGLKAGDGTTASAALRISF